MGIEPTSLQFPKPRTYADAQEMQLRYQAQSAMTRNGRIPQLPTIEEARAFFAKSEDDTDE